MGVGGRNEGEERGRGRKRGLGGGGGGKNSFVACPRHFTIDHASLSRRSTVYS